MNNESNKDEKVVDLSKAREARETDAEATFAFAQIPGIGDEEVGLTDAGVSLLTNPDRREGIVFTAEQALEIGTALIGAAAVWHAMEWQGKQETSDKKGGDEPPAS
jgi:hypothetical protein